MLRDASVFIQKIAGKQDLTAAETQEAFDIVTREDEEGYYTMALLLGLHTKGETADELAGITRSIIGFLPKLSPKVPPDKIMDVSGTGGDALKTFNVSTAAFFVAVSGGVYVAKQAWRTFRGLTGSEEILREVGLDVMAISQEAKKIEGCLETTGGVPYFYGYLTKAFENRERIGGKMAQIGLTFPNPLNFVSFACSPIEMKRRTYGVFDQRYVLVMAELFQKLGYERGMTFHGTDGLDEISNVGPTIICEFSGSEVKQYTVTPEELGIKRAKVEDILATSGEANVADFLRVLYGREMGPKRDIVLANAGAALYIMDVTESLNEGTKMAASLIDEGKAAAKLEEIVEFAGDAQKLADSKKLAGV